MIFSLDLVDLFWSLRQMFLFYKHTKHTSHTQLSLSHFHVLLVAPASFTWTEPSSKAKPNSPTFSISFLPLHAPSSPSSMGNLCALLNPKPAPPTSKKRSSSIRREKKKLDDAAIRDQAIAAAILFKQHQQQQKQNFDRSTSLRYPNGVSKRNNSNSNTLPRSSSSRARSLTDPLLQPHQLVNQVTFLSCLFASEIDYKKS